MKYELIVTQNVWDRNLGQHVTRQITRQTIVLEKKGRYLVEAGLRSFPKSFDAKTLQATKQTQRGQYRYALGEKKE